MCRHVCMSVCVRAAYMWEWGCVCQYEHMQRLEEDTRQLPLFFSALFLPGDRFSYWTRRWSFGLGWLPASSLLASACFCLLMLELEECAVTRGFLYGCWGFKLRSSWSTDLAPQPLFARILTHIGYVYNFYFVYIDFSFIIIHHILIATHFFKWNNEMHQVSFKKTLKINQSIKNILDGIFTRCVYGHDYA